jgi:PadR family transcriptional regulator, regulatory protein PadR
MHDTPYATHMTTSHTAAAPANELFDALRLELRRGCLVVAVLAQLKSEQYGYTLRKSLFDDGLIIDESTLYPLLRRLESQGLLLSEWREENKRNKRFYRLSPSGAQVLAQLLEEWRRINASIDRMVEPEKIQAQQFTREQRVHDQRAQDEHTPDQNAAQFAQILKES